MPAKAENPIVAKSKKKLGKLIAKCRGDNLSQRQLAAKVGLQPSNMKYIEDGINCPTADIYSKLISVLDPPKKIRAELDQAYMTIRNAPPPDVCDRVKKDPNLMSIIRALEDTPLSESQAQQIKELITTFTSQKTEGEKNNG